MFKHVMRGGQIHGITLDVQSPKQSMQGSAWIGRRGTEEEKEKKPSKPGEACMAGWLPPQKYIEQAKKIEDTH